MAENKRPRAGRLGSRQAKATVFLVFGAHADTTGSKSQTPNPKIWPLREASASASAALFAFAAAPRLNRVLQIARIGSIYPKDRALHVFHRPDVDLVAKHVALGNETGQLIEELGRCHFADAFDLDPSVGRRSRESQGFEQRDFAST